MSPQSPTRTWSVLAAVLTVALVGTLILGAWARWRPISEYDVARLTARHTVTQVLESPVTDHRIPRTTLEQQLSALGPAPTPSQQRRLAQRLPADASTPGNLPGAVERLRDLAAAETDPGLAATVAAVAASWSAAEARHDPDAPSLLRPEGERDPEPTDVERCRPELTAVVTQLDRAQYVADAAAARVPDESAPQTAVAELRPELSRLTELPAVTPLYECSPHPARGAYVLPGEITDDPTAAAGTATRELSRASLTAIGTADPSERAWLLDALETAARADAMLSPDQPIPALAGRM